MNNRNYFGQYQDNDRAEQQGHPYDPERQLRYREYRAAEKVFTQKMIEAEDMIDRMEGLYRR